MPGCSSVEASSPLPVCHRPARTPPVSAPEAAGAQPKIHVKVIDTVRRGRSLESPSGMHICQASKTHLVLLHLEAAALWDVALAILAYKQGTVVLEAEKLLVT